MSSGKKKGLGRGLSALFGDEQPKQTSNIKKILSKVAISDLSRNPFQPREVFNESKMDELTNSIKKMELFNQLLLDQINQSRANSR